MPLVVMCGYPCSGKTLRALQTADLLKQHGFHVRLVHEHALPPENSSDPLLEAERDKRKRAALKAEVLRHLRPDTVVILDAPNYVKGFRYELYCGSKAAKTTQCTIYTVTNCDEAWRRNDLRNTDSDDACGETICTPLTNLRIEEESGSTRIGGLPKPDLLRDVASPSDENLASKNVLELEEYYSCQVNEIRKNRVRFDKEYFDSLITRFEEPVSSSRWDRPLLSVHDSSALPLDDILSALRGAPPPPHTATQNPPLQPTNWLHDADRATAQQAEALLSSPELEGVTASRLQRLRRQFLVYARQNHSTVNPADLTGLFKHYVMTTLNQDGD